MNVLAMSSRQVSEQLSLREWLKVCDLVDATYGETVAKSQQCGAWGLAPDKFFVGERKLEVKFDVLSVTRGEDGNTICRLYVEKVGPVETKL